eukprot:TRINITY_DN10087_c0_g1_i1.p2 TRINITY_DN10087_c0_g1~~TRINITY_DN10087_c0_g1_i1.p2  ORF type:complete len:309 (-),score=88.71 TRINITY_DN10087_c0_g1_i1:164-1090(-)
MADAEERTRYDRQIRVWGAEAQRRLRGGRVAAVHLSGLAPEVLKNVVLAGVGAVHLLDPHPVGPADLSANFFLTEGDLGANRAAAACPRVQALNPLVAVTHEAGDGDGWAAERPPEYWAAFDVVVVFDGRIGGPGADQRGGAGGGAGVRQRPRPRVARPRLPGPRPPLSLHREDGDRGRGGRRGVRAPGRRPVQRVVAARPPLRPLLACMTLLQRGAAPGDATVAGLGAAWAAVAARHALPRDALPTEYLDALDRLGSGSLSPVCTVAGGVVAQEVLKALQHVGRPFNNLFVYDALGADLKGLVERLP